MIWPLHASLPAIVGVLTVLGNDARYVVSEHPSCRGARLSTSRSVLGAANKERTGRHHDRRFCGHWRRRGRLARVFQFFLQGSPFHGAGSRAEWSGLRFRLAALFDLCGRSASRLLTFRRRPFSVTMTGSFSASLSRVDKFFDPLRRPRG